MSERTSDERLKELSRLVDAELTVPSRLVRVALDEIDALKAEVQNLQAQLEADQKAGLRWKQQAQALEAEVREKDEALQESRRLHADLVKEVESMASSVFQRRLSNDRRRIENE